MEKPGYQETTDMLELFGSEPDNDYMGHDSIENQTLPNGMAVLKNEINKTDLDSLVQFIKPKLVNNQTMHFGPLPSPLGVLFKYGDFNQMIANYYEIGDGIVDHIDLERFRDRVLICSCYGLCEIIKEPHLYSDDIYAVFLEPGDIVLLEGEAR
ncbi:hypothetical protein HDV01_003385 [Terramyces sp. JEL0728]|nr:hypothetical protein HDV01_003385 [Terramyces sp. JEL0728]